MNFREYVNEGVFSKELFEGKEITNVNDIKDGDTLHYKGITSNDEYDVTVTRVNRLVVDATVDKDYGSDDMIIVTRKKKNLLNDFKVTRI